MVGRGDLLQGLALMSLLAARRLVRWSARAWGPGGARRFFDPAARRRLAAVRTVQPEPPLKLGDPRLQSRDLRRLRRDQRNQLFTRPLPLRIRIRTHRILESKADSAVEKNLPAQPPRHATINLGSYLGVSVRLVGRLGYDAGGTRVVSRLATFCYPKKPLGSLISK